MADEPTDPLDAAIQHAKAEIDAMRAIAADADTLAASPIEHATLYEVDGTGRYAIPHSPGWQVLRGILHDPQVAIDFSTSRYPRFDGVIAEAFGHDALVDRTSPRYQDALYAGLRENLAAVRNQLMQFYYDTLRDGMTADEAAKALYEIATYLAGGLHQHARHGGPHADPTQSFIDMHRAAEPDGRGAQYLYDKITEMDRQSGWLRPFGAIIALFGGTAPHDWRLPEDAQPFRDLGHDPDRLDSLEAVDEALRALEKIEAAQEATAAEREAHATANDLDTLGSQLIYKAEHLKDIAAMSEPVRHDAIEIAKEILRKLKVSIGEVHVLEGLGLKPRDDLNEFGGLTAVALVYERLLAWGRGIDASILQHPSIVAATQALGQIGFIAKLDAKRIAKLSGNLAHAQHLEQQAAKVPAAYSQPQDKTMAGLLDKVERGIDTVLNRVVTITGPAAAVGHSRDKDVGSYMSGTPIAGTAMQVSSEGVGRESTGRQQAAIQEGQNAANRAQIQRVTQQLANQQARNSGTAPSQGGARSGNTAQLAALRQRLQARRSQIQQTVQVGLRNAATRMQALHAHDDDAHHPPHAPGGVTAPNPMATTIAKLDPRLINNIRQMNTTTAGLTTNPVMTGRAAFDKMQQANTYGLKPPVTPPRTLTEEEKKKQQALNPPPPPKKDGRGL